jgi:predicted metalloprotease
VKPNNTANVVGVLATCPKRLIVEMMFVLIASITPHLSLVRIRRPSQKILLEKPAPNLAIDDLRNSHMAVLVHPALP